MLDSESLANIAFAFLIRAWILHVGVPFVLWVVLGAILLLVVLRGSSERVRVAVGLACLFAPVIVGIMYVALRRATHQPPDFWSFFLWLLVVQAAMVIGTFRAFARRSESLYGHKSALN